MKRLRPSPSESTAEWELQFPEWQEPLRDAILERDPKRLAEKTQRVEKMIRDRLQELRTDRDVPTARPSIEEQALIDALNVIRIVLKDRAEQA